MNTKPCETFLRLWVKIAFSFSSLSVHLDGLARFLLNSSVVTHDPCDQYTIYLITHTKKCLLQKCSLSCFRDNQHSQHPKKYKK